MPTVLISAKYKEGINELLSCIARNLHETSKRGIFLIPYDKTGIINTIRTEGKVFTEEYKENGTLIDALVDNKVFYLVEDYLVNF